MRDQVGFCGIWCGSCAAGNGAIVELTRRYEEIVRKYDLEKWAPKDFNFKQFMKGLASIQAMSLCPGCRKGGGPPDCSIRTCARNKGVLSCSQCGKLASCKNFEWLEKGNPRIREDLRKLAGKNQKELVKKWTSELRTKWPHCVLSCKSIQEHRPTSN